MTTRAVCVVAGLEADATDTFKAVVQYLGLDAANRVNQVIEIPGLSGGILPATLQLSIENAVKTDLTTNHGYTFGLLDSVQLITGLA